MSSLPESFGSDASTPTITNRWGELPVRFETAWRNGPRPLLADFLSQIVDSDGVGIQRELLRLDIAYRRLAGESPLPSDYRALLPKQLALIDECLFGETKTILDSPSEDSEHGATLIPPIEFTAEQGVRTGSRESTINFPIAVIGEYDIISEIARGGMGVVYKARHRQLGRIAAVKLIKSGQLADESELKRFQVEAQAAAGLDHPGIVPVYEVGQQNGQHYMALAYIDGKSLWQKVKEAPLPPRDAAQLIQKVADAIDYAHARGIIHRDLKPQNILLTQDEQPKVTDFGLAKRVEDDSGLTATGQVMGTPSYMPPEQALGKVTEVGVLADVYSLGATLYCTLTGRPPFHAASMMETVRHVCEEEPVSLHQLNPSIPPDLETICLKCLRKEPDRRYASAKELAEDLGRFLAGESIKARPVSVMERIVKYTRRHPAVAALAGVILFSLITISIGGIAYNNRVRTERDRAEKNFRLAMSAVDEMLSEVGEQQLAAEPRMEEKRRALLTKALSLNQEFLKERTDDPRVRFETAQAHRRLADVFRLLERQQESLAEYDQAIALLKVLRKSSPRQAAYAQQLAYCWNFRGEVCRVAGQLSDADSAYMNARQILESLLADSPSVPGYRQDLARTLYSQGVLNRERGQLADAEQDLKRASDLLTELLQQSPNDATIRQHLARARLNQGTVIRSKARETEARRAYDRAIDILNTLANQFPDQPDYKHELAIACNNCGNLFSQNGKLNEAAKLHQRARDLFQKLAHDFPKVPKYRQELANTWNSIGFVDSQRGMTDETLTAWNQAALLLEGLISEYSTVTTYQGDLGMVCGNLGLTYFAQSQFQEARTQFARSVERLRLVASANPSVVFYSELLRDNTRNLAETLVVLKDHAAAADMALALANFASANSADKYATACFLARCISLVEQDKTLSTQGRQAVSQSYATESLASLKTAFEGGFKDLPQFQRDRDTIFQAFATREDFQNLVRKVTTKPSKP